MKSTAVNRLNGSFNKIIANAGEDCIILVSKHQEPHYYYYYYGIFIL